MLSLKTLLFVSVACLAQLAAAGPLDVRDSPKLICVADGSKGGDRTQQSDLCTVSCGKPSPVPFIRLRSRGSAGYVQMLIPNLQPGFVGVQPKLQASCATARMLPWNSPLRLWAFDVEMPPTVVGTWTSNRL